VVDVSGGIGSTSMLLASAYAEVDTDGASLTHTFPLHQLFF
jgi:hypothetical protein